jgi:Tfp pilus assembly protein PilE
MRTGMTLVEIIIVVILFSLMAIMSAELYQRGVFAERKLGVKIDLFHRAQIASLHMARELRHATEIVSPPETLLPQVPAKSRPYVVFVNELNEIIVLYVNDKGQLIRQNRNKLNTPEENTTLATGIKRLRVHRYGHRIVNYHVFLEDENNKEQFNLISAMAVRNSIH